MSNPQFPQGQLQRLKASLHFADSPELNVSSSLMGRNGMHLTLEGKSALSLPTMTGTVISPEPYMMFSLTVELLKSQSFANRYKQRIETNSTVGNGTVWPDSTTMEPYALMNCVITGVRDMPFNGQDPAFAVTIEGYWPVNDTLYGG